MQIDWYERRSELRVGQVFSTMHGAIVRLDRRVPGDGTDWYADVLIGETFSCEDHQVHPGDLVERLKDKEV